MVEFSHLLAEKGNSLMSGTSKRMRMDTRFMLEEVVIPLPTPRSYSDSACEFKYGNRSIYM